MKTTYVPERVQKTQTYLEKKEKHVWLGYILIEKHFTMAVIQRDFEDASYIFVVKSQFVEFSSQRKTKHRKFDPFLKFFDDWKRWILRAIPGAQLGNLMRLTWQVKVQRSVVFDGAWQYCTQSQLLRDATSNIYYNQLLRPPSRLNPMLPRYVIKCGSFIWV